MYPTEAIPDNDKAFRRIHKVYLKDGKITPSGFKGNSNNKDSMSVNWERYSTAEKTKCEAPQPQENAVASFNVGEARKIGNVLVCHDPLCNNRAHSTISGVKPPKVRLQLCSISKLEISIN